MVKRYFEFINEADEKKDVQAKPEETDSSDSSKFNEIKEEVKSMIEDTIKNSGGEFSSFVESFVKNPDDIKIEGFINDSDVYEFFLKWRNEIDEILSSIKFFDKLPSEFNAFGLYEYVIKGTQKAVEEVVSMLK